MIEYIARHWAALQQMRRERAEEERRHQPEIHDWNNCETWSDFVNRAANERQNSVVTCCLAVLALVVILALAVQEFDAALGVVVR